MAHSLPYSMSYITPHQHPTYMLATHAQHPHPHLPGSVHLVSPQMRVEQPVRKRPKYTRSKTGCLTCRGKKIKCDESKPKCTRCTHGQRECTWPDPAPAKKKTPVRKNSANQDRVSNTDSASRSSDSSPTSRDHTPSTRDVDSSIQGMPILDHDRRSSQVYPSYTDPNTLERRQSLPHTGSHTHLSSHTMTPLSSGTTLQTYSTPLTGSYDYNQSPNGSISSRSNSRPSTANSLPPPPSRYSGPGLENAHYEPTGVPRWDPLSDPRNDAAYAYHPSPDSDLMARSYEHVGRI